MQRPQKKPYMDPRLKQSAEDGDIDVLYSILAHDPDVLERIDRMPSVDTPLHEAVRNGNSHYAMEIASLKPSFAWKLNHLGLSPIHLALENGHQELVMWFTTIDSELVRVKGKGMITPLHYAAQIENLEILAGFLCICPSSIYDLTVKYETAVHVALKNGKFRAFKVLFGWLRRVNKEVILKNQDEDGNDAFHIATSTNQPEVMKMLIGYGYDFDVNTKNRSGLTAMDIFYLQRSWLDPEVGNILHHAKAKRASELGASGPTTTTANGPTLAGYLSSDLSFSEYLKKILGVSDQIKNKFPNEVRNVVLVVAILTATATYQAILSPPGGYWQDNEDPSASANATMISNATTGAVKELRHIAGEMILGTRNLGLFFTLNSAAFFTSVCIILIIIVGLPFSGMLAAATILLSFSYFLALAFTFPSADTPFVVIGACMTLFGSAAAACYIHLLQALYKGKAYIFYGRWRVNLGGFI